MAGFGQVQPFSASPQNSQKADLIVSFFIFDFSSLRLQKMGHRENHYAPAFLLREWEAGADGKLTQYSWLRGDLRMDRYKAKSVGKQRDLYTRGTAANEINVDIEKAFLGPHVDEPAAGVHKKIIETGVRSLMGGEKEIWARFLVAQMMRTPHMIERLKVRGTEILQKGMDERPEEDKAVRDADYPETLREWAEREMPSLYEDFGISALPVLIESEVLLGAVANGHWATRSFRQAGFNLVVGDCPLLYYGTMASNFLLALPLSPQCVFFSFSSQQVWDAHLNRHADAHMVAKINRSSAMESARYMYATDDRHEPLARRYLKDLKTRAAVGR